MEHVAPPAGLPDEGAQMVHGGTQVGLTVEQAEAKLKQCGRNEYQQGAPPTLLKHLADQLADPIFITVVLCAATALIANGEGPYADNVIYYIPGIAMFVVVAAQAAVAARARQQAGAAQQALAKATQASALAVRGGRQTKVSVPTLVPGDLVLLSEGDVVPADLHLTEAQGLQVCEFPVTGEPEPVAKRASAGQAEAPPVETCLFAGCYVTAGTGMGYITATGAKTRIHQRAGGAKRARLPAMLLGAKEQTAIQRQEEGLGRRVAVVVLVACLLFFLVGLAARREDVANPRSPLWLHMLLGTLALAVHALPHGTRMCTSLALSVRGRGLLERGVLARGLGVVDRLGSLSVLCCGTAGALSEGNPRVAGVWSGGVHYVVDGSGFEASSAAVCREGSSADARDETGVQATLLAAALCSARVSAVGAAREAIKGAARAAGIAVETVEAEYPTMLEVPYCAARRTALTVADVAGRDRFGASGMLLPARTKYLAACLGAVEDVLELCSERLLPDGRASALKGAARAEVMRAVESYAQQGATVWAVATRSLDKLGVDVAAPSDRTLGEVCKGMRLLGLVACADPQREGVPESILMARQAGIRAVLLTGDALQTAVAVAREAGILRPEDDASELAVDCQRLRPHGGYLPPAELDTLVSSARVFARAAPQDKVQVLCSLQRRGAVVSLVGAETSDEPAVRAADVGIALGARSTEVATAAAGVVIVSDRFSAIIDAVQSGRAVYAIARRAAAFSLSTSVAAVLQLLFCVVVGLPVMRTPLQMLFLIFVVDFPALFAFVAEPCDVATLKARPRPRNEAFLLGWMWVSALLNAVFLAVVVTVVYVLALQHYCDGKLHQDDMHRLSNLRNRVSDAQTAALLCFAWAAHLRAFTARSFDEPVWRGLAGNATTLKSVYGGQLLLYAGLLIPFVCDEILQVRGIEMGRFGWLSAFIGAVIFLVLSEGCKYAIAFPANRYRRDMGLRYVADEAGLLPPTVAHVPAVESKSPAKGGVGSMQEEAELVDPFGGRRGSAQEPEKKKKHLLVYSRCPCLPSLLCSAPLR